MPEREPDSAAAIPDPEETARSAGLRYVSDEQRGITRAGEHPAFRYLKADGAPVTDERALDRIRKLAIPPAWTDVWICASANGHLQATGRDARGRKQYRYHPRFREVREETKYEHMMAFAKALPVASFVEETRGFGYLGLAQIVAEAGDLSNYANPAKLWKRFGLAVIDGRAQRRVADKELAIVHGLLIRAIQMHAVSASTRLIGQPDQMK